MVKKELKLDYDYSLFDMWPFVTRKDLSYFEIGWIDLRNFCNSVAA